VISNPILISLLMNNSKFKSRELKGSSKTEKNSLQIVNIIIIYLNNGI
jgi:hypothetical protein